MGYARPEVTAEPQLARRSFGKYELLSLIARGGMGEVYLATLRGELGFEKKLVVKTIRRDLVEDEKFVDLFAAEAKTAVALTHGNIVPIYELGRSDETFYIAMGYVDGPSVSQLLKQHKGRVEAVDVATALFVVREVLTGLAYAHTRESGRPPVVHRDISPRNILVDRSGQVRIVDFGIAMPADKQVAMSGGSTGYMAPEQARAAAADPSADVFSTACVLYELLTLDQAFPNEGVWQDPDLSLVPTPLRSLLADAMAVAPDKRPSDAGVFLRRLNPVLAELAPTYTTQDLAEHLRDFFPEGWASPEANDNVSGTPATPPALTQTFATRLTAVKPEPADAETGNAGDDDDNTQVPAVSPAPAPSDSPKGKLGLTPILVAAAAAAGITWFALQPGEQPAPSEETATRTTADDAPEPDPTANAILPDEPPDPQTLTPFVLTVLPADVGATILLGGKPVAGPPFEIEVPEDEPLAGVVSAPGFFDKSFQISPDDRGVLGTTVKLDAKEHGFLKVIAPGVNYAFVEVDGKRIKGKTTPIEKHKLLEGKHRVRVLCPAQVCSVEKKLFDKNVEVSPGKLTKVEAN
jgi:serine/threonine-protein kinase